MEQPVLEPPGMDARSQFDSTIRQELRDDLRPLVSEDAERTFFRSDERDSRLHSLRGEL